MDGAAGAGAAGELPAKADASPSQSGAARTPPKPVAADGDDDDDDLADVEVPEDGDGSEVDEDWGAKLLSLRQAKSRRTAVLRDAASARPLLWSFLITSLPLLAK